MGTARIRLLLGGGPTGVVALGKRYYDDFTDFDNDLVDGSYTKSDLFRLRYFLTFDTLGLEETELGKMR